MTAQDYQRLMDQTQAQLDANLVTNAGVIERYERREAQVNTLAILTVGLC